MSMYRTHDLQQLILGGIPEELRAEMWLVASGAIHEVGEGVGVMGFKISKWFEV